MKSCIQLLRWRAVNKAFMSNEFEMVYWNAGITLVAALGSTCHVFCITIWFSFISILLLHSFVCDQWSITTLMKKIGLEEPLVYKLPMSIHRLPLCAKPAHSHHHHQPLSSLQDKGLPQPSSLSLLAACLFHVTWAKLLISSLHLVLCLPCLFFFYYPWVASLLL